MPPSPSLRRTRSRPNCSGKLSSVGESGGGSQSAMSCGQVSGDIVVGSEVIKGWPHFLQQTVRPRSSGAMLYDASHPGLGQDTLVGDMDSPSWRIDHADRTR